MSAEEHPLIALLSSIRVDKFRYGPDKPLVVLRSHWPVERALKVLLRHSITCAVRGSRRSLLAASPPSRAFPRLP